MYKPISFFKPPSATNNQPPGNLMKEELFPRQICQQQSKKSANRYSDDFENEDDEHQDGKENVKPVYKTYVSRIKPPTKISNVYYSRPSVFPPTTV